MSQAVKEKVHSYLYTLFSMNGRLGCPICLVRIANLKVIGENDLNVYHM